MTKKGKYYLLDEILDQRIQNGMVEYFIKWKGYSSKHNSWEPESFLRKDYLRELIAKRTSFKASTKRTTSTKAAPHSTKRTTSTDAAPRKPTKNRVSTKAGMTKQSSTDVSTENANDDEFFNIEQFLAKRIVNNEIHYLVHWKGYGTDESTWEPEGRLKNDYCKNLFNRFKNAFV